MLSLTRFGFEGRQPSTHWVNIWGFGGFNAAVHVVLLLLDWRKIKIRLGVYFSPDFGSGTVCKVNTHNLKKLNLWPTLTVFSESLQLCNLVSSAHLSDDQDHWEKWPIIWRSNGCLWQMCCSWQPELRVRHSFLHWKWTNASRKEKHFRLTDWVFPERNQSLSSLKMKMTLHHKTLRVSSNEDVLICVSDSDIILTTQLVIPERSDSDYNFLHRVFL